HRVASSPVADFAGDSAEKPAPHLRVHTVNIFVRDMERSLRFYLDQLGFRLAFDVHLQNGQRWLAVAPPNGTAVLTLIAPEPASEQYKLIRRHTGIALVTEDVAATYVQWRKRGVRFGHTPRLRRMKYHQVEESAAGSLLLGKQTPIWGGVFTRFEDIDGNIFSLVSLDEMNQAVEAQRRIEAEKAEAERRAAHEMEIARQVQARLFPQSLPPMKTLDYAGTCIQAQEVGGDYYDFLHL